jgi:hypothetical protein
MNYSNLSTDFEEFSYPSYDNENRFEYGEVEWGFGEGYGRRDGSGIGDGYADVPLNEITTYMRESRYGSGFGDGQEFGRRNGNGVGEVPWNSPGSIIL